MLDLAHLGITEPFDLLAWAVVLLCVTVAVLRDWPRCWPTLWPHLKHYD